MSLRRQLLTVLIVGYACAALINVFVLGRLLRAGERSLQEQTAAEFLEFGVETVDFAAEHFFERLTAAIHSGISPRELDFDRFVAPEELIILANSRGEVLRKSIEEPRLSALLSRDRLREPWQRYPVTQEREFALDNYEALRSSQDPKLPIRIVFRLFPEAEVAVGYGRLYYDVLARQLYLMEESRRRTRSSFILGASVFLVLGLFIAAISDRLLNRLITAPVTRLVDELLDIGPATRRRSVTVTGPKELAEVSASINQMSQSLARSIEESERKTRQVKESLQEKETLLREVHHRVKNNMQMTASLLRMQMDGIDDERNRGHFTDALSRITAMALVHELLYESPRISRVDPRTYIEDLLSQLLSTIGEARVKRKIEIDAPELGPSRILPLGLIVNELVSNSIKYAIQGEHSGEIIITLSKMRPQELLLEYSDSGPGLPAGIDPHNTDTLGLNLIVSLSEQLGGSPEFRRGAPFRFSLSWKETA